MEYLLAICVAVGLAAACGFRVFVPMLLMGVCAKIGWFSLSGGFDWMASWPAIVAFGCASLVEVIGYYVPWVDNLLDAIATPIAIVAGVIVAASGLSVIEMDPLLMWSAAVVAGGSAAGLIKGTAAMLRAGSTATTGGAGNFIVATIELIASVVLTILAIVVPIVAAVVVLLIAVLIVRVILRARKLRRSVDADAATTQS